MLCTANTSRILMESRRLVHSSTSCHVTGHFGRAIRRAFLIAKSRSGEIIEIANFFQTRFKLWSSVFKLLNFQNIEKLISLHMHFNPRGINERFLFN